MVEIIGQNKNDYSVGDPARQKDGRHVTLTSPGSARDALDEAAAQNSMYVTENRQQIYQQLRQSGCEDPSTHPLLANEPGAFMREPCAMAVFMLCSDALQVRDRRIAELEQRSADLEARGTTES